MRGFFRNFKGVNTFAFGKPERLKSRKQIDALFAGGRSITRFPVRLRYQLCPRPEGAPPVQAGVSVSRKAFKRAVDRNRIKRQLREAYRLQKAPLLQTVSKTDRQVVLFLIYTGKDQQPFDAIVSAVTHCLDGLHQKVLAYHENAH
jgi:ribonuclease P protein component